MVHGRRLAGIGGAIGMAMLAAGLACAQPAAPRAPSTGAMPSGLVPAMLAGGRDGVVALTDFLGRGALSAPEMTRRAVALIQALGAQGGTGRPEDMIRAVDRVAGLAARLLATGSIMRLAIDGGYRPPAGAIALDFGPPDAPAMDGFEKVVPGDPRIAGRQLTGLRRPLDQPLLAGGIVGIEKIAIRLPPGDYRIVLMTQHLGEPQIVERPFGRSLRINGVPLLVGRSAAPQWLGAAVLSDRGAATLTGGRGETAGGLLSGALDPDAARRVGDQQGGALLIEARAPDGRLTIEMADFGQGRGYIAGLLIEPANRTSGLVLDARAHDAVLPLDMRLALEAEILAAAASVLEQIATAAGGETPAPSPAFEAAEVVSGN